MAYLIETRANLGAMPAPSPHDRQETGAEEQQAIALLSSAHNMFSHLANDLPEPVAGSVLRIERANTAREPIDAMVVAQRARAVDNLGRLFALMLDRPNARVLAYPFSGYSLTRTAIESAAVGLWIIAPNRKASRVLRALQRSHQHELEALNFVEVAGEADVLEAARARYERVVRRLEELKDTVGPLRQRQLGLPPSYTDILRSVSSRVPGSRTQYEVTSPLVAWKISSAFIHGSETVIRSLSDVRQMSEFVDGVATFELTPSLRLAAGLASTSVSLLATLDARYIELATHNPAGQPLRSS